ncbi:Amino-acid carrier protein AlsT [Rubripirellula lacrimiformis]|uniref:Amino-acid carrier protein AlsT n=1 Tax=Rubripirellula lacrimiformis TaxID=1930273 RepID=A0A517N5N1_9BACT|nr:alanine/glycine:cation symporter family protein [Rubripirellula lacrimiformis]QDT02434.1 Amino-acid carrier protein AlsT [Rubripirellula lacrimiformis]
MPTARLLILPVLLCLLSAPFASAQSDTPPPPVPPPVAGETSDDAPESPQAVDADAVDADAATSTDTEANAEAETDTDAPPQTWSHKIDEAFGKYIVANAAFVIFYDFGTEQWLGTKIPFVVVWLLFGAIFLTIRMGFINLRAFRHAIDLIRGVYDSPDEPGEVTHFQALAAALSATVGLGNIAGVAIAIGTGGPGATLWIIMIGLLGMTSKFAECTLGQLYRVTDEKGHVLGGPMRYLKTGLADIGMGGLGSVLAVIFMLLCIGASFGGGNAFQVGQSLEAIRGDVPILQTHPVIYGLVMAFAVGVVIVGGIRSIGAVAGKIVPFMCFAYVAAALYILILHYAAIPAAVVTIVTEAFNPKAMYGGFLGVLVIGIKRAVFSNEAGVGSAAIAHSAAKTDEPVSEGIVALLEPFIDTVVVCTITALVVVVTGAYSAPEMESAIAADQGAKVTLHAFAVGGHDWFRYILYFAVVLFAYSTCISWSYYGERCWVQLFGASSSVFYKILFLMFTVLGSIVTRGNILDFSDLMILGMSFPNLLGVFLLSGVVRRQLDSYWGKYKSGELKRTDSI